MKTKMTFAQHVSLIDRIKEVKKEHRDVVLILIVSSRYKDIWQSPVSESAGSLSVADYFTDLVDRIMNNGEYDKAVNYACEIIFNENDKPDKVGSLIWEYFHHVHTTSIDWYYADLANCEIDKFLNNQTMNYESEIYSAMYEIYSNPENKDRYGQVGISYYNANNLKRRMSDGAFDYLERGCSKYGKLETYGGKLGIYKALSPTSEFYQQTKTK